MFGLLQILTAQFGLKRAAAVHFVDHCQNALIIAAQNGEIPIPPGSAVAFYKTFSTAMRETLTLPGKTDSRSANRRDQPKYLLATSLCAAISRACSCGRQLLLNQFALLIEFVESSSAFPRFRALAISFCSAMVFNLANPIIAPRDRKSDEQKRNHIR